MNHDRQNRTFSRVETLLKGYARKVNSPAAQPLFRGGFSFSEEMDEKTLKNISSIPEPLLRFLLSINRKLDAIVNLSSQNVLPRDFPIELKIVEISGAGILFQKNDAISLNDHLEIVITLSQFPLKLVGVTGTVQRLDEFAGDDVFAFNFQQVRESDRESIVQFVFQEQREQIRERKHNGND